MRNSLSHTRCDENRQGKEYPRYIRPSRSCAHRITLLGTELHEHTGNSLSGRRTAPKGCTISKLSVSLEVGVDAHSITTLKSTRSRERRRRSRLMDQHGNSRGSGRKFQSKVQGFEFVVGNLVEILGRGQLCSMSL